MTFELDYNKLLHYAKACIKGAYSLTEYDLVNDAFVYFYDKEYSFAEAKKIISKLSSGDDGHNLTSLERVGKKDLSKDHEKYCKKCNDSKPVSAFYWNFDLSKKVYTHSTFCKECLSSERKKRHKIEYQVNKIVRKATYPIKDPATVRKNNVKGTKLKRVRVTVPKDENGKPTTTYHQRKKERNKSLISYNTKNLTDWYIINILIAQKVELRSITKDMIEQKRNELSSFFIS